MPDSKWLDEPTEADYQAALDYMTLLLGEEQAAEGLALLKESEVVHRKAKDILRASGHDPLPEGGAEVTRAHHFGGPASPVLLFRAYPMIVASGFAQVCAAYYRDPETEIPCLIT